MKPKSVIIKQMLKSELSQIYKQITGKRKITVLFSMQDISIVREELRQSVSEFIEGVEVVVIYEVF